jgi:hypothetical protein
MRYSVFTAIEHIEAESPAEAYDEWCDQPTHPMIVEEDAPETELGFTVTEFVWFGSPPITTIEQIVETLYNFSDAELRGLATECLMITDGPDKRSLNQVEGLNE